jgi:NADPH:quinone reductase-like Zn-dependent oxidoreductase
MKAAGVRDFGASVELLDLPDPSPPRADEVLIAVQAAVVGNWDEVIRTGDWDTGIKPPMALGVAAAGVVTAVGAQVTGIDVGALVAAHSIPLRDQGAWAQALLVAASDVAPVPAGVSAEAAAAAVIPALTADQALVDALRVQPGQTVVVNGAGGVTGGMLVQMAASYGARVVATASADSTNRVYALGARAVVDYRQPGWPANVCELTGGADAAVNAAPGGAAEAAVTVRDGGRLATITGDPPQPGRGIEVTSVYVSPNGPRLTHLLMLLSTGSITVEVAARRPLDEAALALAEARHGMRGGAVVLVP